MARATPQVAGATLGDRAGTAQSIAVDTPAWYAWLERATTFAFVGVAGHFTARKERRGRAGGYWKAYRKRAGVVQSAYLGKSADLTLERLQVAAVTLAASPIAGNESARPSRGPLVGEPAAHAAALPTGTITFLFTDIEGSTLLWEQHPQAMPVTLARHDTLVRQAVESHSGVVFKTVGDGVHAVFVRAADALAAALAAQRALHAEP
jgi:hypothetical protein